jgi:peptidoglycan/xylan/chitin deacetylase (PgdA/CDA1 family)
VPWIDIWPAGYAWAVVLTHDVETRTGYEQMELLRATERNAGLVSSWNFVPSRNPKEARYEVEASMLTRLRREGCEVGVHGLHHDGRDLESLSTLLKRLPDMRSFAERWHAVGFRAPATQRNWNWMPLLGFDYDSSFSDSAPYEPTPGGCCSYFPFFNESMVELPITLAQDHTQFVILRERDGSAWLNKAHAIRELGGMALVLTHPDYADDAVMMQAYRELVEALSDDPGAWHALPCEVSAWWRRRAQSWLESSADGWKIRGPAAEGRVRLGTGPAVPIQAEAHGAAAW